MNKNIIILSLLLLSFNFHSFGQTINIGTQSDIAQQESTAAISTINSEDLIKDCI